MYLKENTNYLYCTAVIQTTGKVSYEQLVEHLEALRAKTVKEPGCVLFEIVPLESALGRFALWEIWQNQESFITITNRTIRKNFLLRNLTRLNFSKAQRR